MAQPGHFIEQTQHKHQLCLNVWRLHKTLSQHFMPFVVFMEDVLNDTSLSMFLTASSTMIQDVLEL